MYHDIKRHHMVHGYHMMPLYIMVHRFHSAHYIYTSVLMCLNTVVNRIIKTKLNFPLSPRFSLSLVMHPFILFPTYHHAWWALLDVSFNMSYSPLIFNHLPSGFNALNAVISILKHTTTLFSLFDHYILSREWEVIVDQVHNNYHGKPMVL